jgi:hypothetical protein
VICSDVRCEQIPAVMQTNLAQSTERRNPAVSVEVIRRLIHLFKLDRDTLRAGFRQSASSRVVIPVDGTGFFAVQVCSIAGEGNEVAHGVNAAR